MDDILLTVEGAIPPDVEGKTFQVHVLPGNRIRLYPVTMILDARCPVIIKGERCGEKVGHAGKHCWAGGD